MRRSISIVSALIFIPAIALALDFSPLQKFNDVRSSSPEFAGISLLVRAGAVQGYSAKFFGTTRFINRAEFLKIAMKARGTGSGTVYAARTCFDDVASADWFSPFVCAAKDLNIVTGRTPQKFYPADTVAYGEALAILDRLYRYDITDISGRDWAEAYYQAAAGRKVDLPITISLDKPLTRGLAARLVAAFLAESEGQLDSLRLAESGNYQATSSSSPSSVSSVSSSSSSSVSSISSVPSVSSVFTLPPVDHFLIVGKASDALASTVLRSTGEAAHISAVQVKFYSDVKSLKSLELTTLTGQVLLTLIKRTTTDVSDYKQIFEVQPTLETQPSIPADTDVPLILRAQVRSVDDAGYSDEFMEMRSFTVTYHGDNTFETKTLTVPAPFTKNQTAFGHITKVERVTPDTAKIVSGTGKLIGVFGFTGDALIGKILALDQLIFTVVSNDVSAQNWSLVLPVTGAKVPCTVSQDIYVSCLNLADSIGKLETGKELILNLAADLTLTGISPSLKAGLNEAGSPAALGSVQWTDGSGHFKWLEGKSPLAGGTLLK